MSLDITQDPYAAADAAAPSSRPTLAAQDLAEAPRERLGVPWATVVLLGVAMAYVDGFWMTAIRNAVGAIERTQGPFVSWLRESTMLIPLFLLATLVAVTIGLRRFGPTLSRRAFWATFGLVVLAGTLAGTLAIAASAAYDFHLQSLQLQFMENLHGTCAVDNCLAKQESASLWLQVRAVAWGSVILLVANLVTVAWITAMRGGRLDVARLRSATSRLPRPRNRYDDLRILLVAGLLGSGVIHAAVAPSHLNHWNAASLFFVALAVAEIGVAVWLLADPTPSAVFAAAVVAVVPLSVWLLSRAVGLPFGPEAGVRESVGLADLAVVLLEIATLALAAVLIGGEWLRQRPSRSPHARWITLLLAAAITAIGLAGSGLAVFDDYGVAPQDPSAAHSIHPGH